MKRRTFLKTAGAAGLIGSAAPNLLLGAAKDSPNEKLNIGIIGVGGRGSANMRGVSSENIVALCDVNGKTLAKAKEIAATIAQRNPDAVRAAKRLHNRMHDETGEDMLMAESVEQAGVIRQPNQIEAVMAGMAKRAPNFTDAA